MNLFNNNKKYNDTFILFKVMKDILRSLNIYWKLCKRRLNYCY